MAVAVVEAAGVMPFGGRTRLDGVVGEGQVERAELAAEEAGGVKRLQFLLLADPFEPLADVDERRASPGCAGRAPGPSTRPMCGAATVCGGT